MVAGHFPELNSDTNTQTNPVLKVKAVACYRLFPGIWKIYLVHHWSRNISLVVWWEIVTSSSVTTAMPPPHRQKISSMYTGSYKRHLGCQQSVYATYNTYTLVDVVGWGGMWWDEVEWGVEPFYRFSYTYNNKIWKKTNVAQRVTRSELKRLGVCFKYFVESRKRTFYTGLPYIMNWPGDKKKSVF